MNAIQEIVRQISEGAVFTNFRTAYNLMAMAVDATEEENYANNLDNMFRILHNCIESARLDFFANHKRCDAEDVSLRFEKWIGLFMPEFLVVRGRFLAPSG